MNTHLVWHRNRWATASKIPVIILITLILLSPKPTGTSSPSLRSSQTFTILFLIKPLNPEAASRTGYIEFLPNASDTTSLKYYNNGDIGMYPSGSYHVSIGYSYKGSSPFAGWSSSSGVVVANPAGSSTVVTITGSGFLSASFDCEGFFGPCRFDYIPISFILTGFAAIVVAVGVSSRRKNKATLGSGHG